MDGSKIELEKNVKQKKIKTKWCFKDFENKKRKLKNSAAYSNNFSREDEKGNKQTKDDRINLKRIYFTKRLASIYFLYIKRIILNLVCFIIKSCDLNFTFKIKS